VTEPLICVCAVQADTCSCRLANSELSTTETILCRAFTEDNEELDSFHSMMRDHYDLAREFLGSCQKDSKTFFYSIQNENNLGLPMHTIPAELFQYVPPVVLALNPRLRCWNVHCSKILLNEKLLIL